MTINRREFIKQAGTGLAGVFIMPEVKNSVTPEVSEDCVGMLYDATQCIGCRNCEVACKEHHDPNAAALNIREPDLTADTWTLIELYQDQRNTSVYSFVKHQCMHCVDPACVSACPVGALIKTESGAVIYDEKICIGCRYCMAACPFEIPKYEWDKVFPRVQKCNFCIDRQSEGLQPACAEACHIGALKFGKRSDLLVEAKERIQNDPGNYINHVYGENEVGGTSNLYLSKVPFEKLGLPTLNSASLPSLTWPWMKAVPGVAVVVGAMMTFLYWFTGRSAKLVTEEINDDTSS